MNDERWHTEDKKAVIGRIVRRVASTFEGRFSPDDLADWESFQRDVPMCAEDHVRQLRDTSDRYFVPDLAAILSAIRAVPEDKTSG